MEKVNLKAQIREGLGKEAAKRLRNRGFIPAIVYKGNKSLNIEIPSKSFLEAIHTKAGENVIINLQVENKTSRNTVIKEIQYHPVKGDVLHVDFNEISLTEALTVKVPVAVKGEAEGIKEGGVLEHILWEIEIECLPTDIPEDIPVDVSSLKIGDSILVKDLHLPPEIKVLSDPEATVVTLAVPKVEEPEEAKPEEEMVEPEVIMEKKPEEEEEAAAEEGKAPAARAQGKEQEKKEKPKEKKQKE